MSTSQWLCETLHTNGTCQNFTMEGAGKLLDPEFLDPEKTASATKPIDNRHLGHGIRHVRKHVCLRTHDLQSLLTLMSNWLFKAQSCLGHVNAHALQGLRAM